MAYSDQSFVDKKSSVKKKTAALPKVNKKPSVAKKEKTKSKKLAKAEKAIKKELPKIAKKIEKKDSIQEGIYCHIRVLNPPHLELLSDVKKAGAYYEDTENCREAAIRLTKTYCGHSLMGELDVDIVIKDRTQDGDKTLERVAESIECAI